MHTQIFVWKLTDRWDRYMFHQANMRVQDVPVTSIGGKSGRFSLLMTWTEVVTGELTRLYVRASSLRFLRLFERNANHTQNIVAY